MRSQLPLLLLTLTLLCPVSWPAASAAVRPAIRPVAVRQAEDNRLTDFQRQFFESRIRPVLIEHCYECHNSESAESGLNLDHRAALLAGGESGPVIDRQQPQKSLLLQVVRHDIKGVEMPEGGGKLAPSIIADLTQWVEMGAPDPRDQPPSAEELQSATSWEAIRNKRSQWWSFQPITATEPSGAAEHPVDVFVNRRLQQQQLTPSSKADRRTLLHRAAFALTGLPPTPEQTRMFLDDPSEEAFERLVDRLLASPAFGERWARHWMDWIRYAESHGSEGDPRIENAWMYRDYLIRALNEDVAYDQLVREHIAGDLLPQPRINADLQLNESLIGTAHWRMVFHGFAPTDALDEKVRFTDDQIDAFSKAFLGLTVSCARCHHHKFDAISQDDYYALFGILGSTRPGRSAADSPEKLNTSRAELEQLKPQIRSALAADWQDTLAEGAMRLLAVKGKSETAVQRLLNVPDETDVPAHWARLRQQVAAEGKAAQQSVPDEYKRWRFDCGGVSDWFAHGIGVSGTPAAAGDFLIHTEDGMALQRIVPSGLISGRLSSKHAARLESPDFSLNREYDIWMQVAGSGEAACRYVVQNYPRNGTVYPVRTLNDANWSWQKLDVAYWQGDTIHLELTTAKDAPLLTRGATRSWFGVRDVRVLPRGASLPRLSLESLAALFAVTADAEPQSPQAAAETIVRAVTQIVDRWRENRVTDAEALLLNELLTLEVLPNRCDELPRAGSLIQHYQRLEDRIPVPVRVPTLGEWRGQDQRLFERGNHKTPAHEVPRRFLEAIDPTPYASTLSGRRELAEDVLADDNPLARRVIVNRLWHHLFGSGIVTTPDNFGRLGAEPTHPELLDYLATRFVRDDWSLKSMIRLMITSETWQRSSQPSTEVARLDPANQWLSHANVRRLEAEAIRDRLLLASGQLDPRQFGPPVSGSSNRRSVYVSVIRNRLDPFLSTFDAPVPFGARGRRDRTNVPAQSLLLLNDPFVRKAAQQAVQGMGTSSVDRAQGVVNLWQRVLQRDPMAEEVEQSLDLLNALRSSNDRIRQQRKQLDEEIRGLDQRLGQILTPAREALMRAAEQHGVPTTDLAPVAVWDFGQGPQDQIGGLHGQLEGTARVEGGRLVLDGGGWMRTPALSQPLAAKTLEARVVLSSLDQRGGGVLSVQTPDGQFFDAIVYAEQKPRRWLAGSNFFERTQSLAGPAEMSEDETVHVVITYAADGTITFYRNGVPYGRSYRKGLYRFAADNSQVLLGMRHGTSLAGSRMFRGAVIDARLYDRALSADEVRAAAESDATFVSDRAVLASLSDEQRQQVELLTAQRKEREVRRGAMATPAAPGQEWSELAHALFNMKEFIYVR